MSQHARWVVPARTLLVLYVVVPALLVLGPLPLNLLSSTARSVDWALPGGFNAARHQVEVFGNVLMFVPIGFLLCGALPHVRRMRILGGCALASIFIELFQLAVASGRYPSVRDVALNTFGAALGITLAGLVFRTRAPRR